MYALFEEAGKFLAGRILSEAEASAQVELDSGKRVKVKAAAMLLKFDKPTPAVLLAEAMALSPSIELALAYEFAPEEEFGFADLAQDYFNSASTVQQVAALLCLPLAVAAQIAPAKPTATPPQLIMPPARDRSGKDCRRMRVAEPGTSMAKVSASIRTNRLLPPPAAPP